MKIESALETVWRPNLARLGHDASLERREHSSSLRSLDYLDISSSKVPQQLPTPTYYSEAPTDQRSFMGELYHTANPLPERRNYSNMGSNASRPILNASDALSAAASNPVFEPVDVTEMPPPTAFSALSFSSTAFDYDAILDDIAAIDQTSRMESDPQFMTNLGFAPGSNLAEVLTHDFMGVS